MGWLRKGLLTVSLLGILFSGMGFAVTFVDERRFEDMTRLLVIWHVEREIKATVALPSAKEGGALGALRNRMADSAEFGERLFGSDLPERIAEKTAELCVCQLGIEDRAEHQRRFNDARDRIATAIRNGLSGGVALTRLKIETLDDLISGYYVETVDGLKRDLRIFFGSNLALYVTVGLGVLFSALGNALGYQLFCCSWGRSSQAGCIYSDRTGFPPFCSIAGRVSPIWAGSGSSQYFWPTSS